MKRILFCIAIMAVIISACGRNKTSVTETPAVGQEAQAPTAAGVGESDTEAEAVPTIAQAQGADQTGTDSQPVATYTPFPTFTPYPTYTPYPSPTPLPTATPIPPTAPPTTVAPQTPTSTAIATAMPITETASPTALPTETPTGPPEPSGAAAPAAAAPTIDLQRIEDTDPGPPFTVLVSTIRVQKNGKYRVTGMVRNDGSQVYGDVGVIGTFFDDQGNRLGPVQVHAPCPLLEPGAACPFSLETYPRGQVKYLLHPVGAPVVYGQPASLAVSGVSISNDAIGNVRITGAATNRHPFAVANANIAGSLIDAGGKIVSLGSTFVPGEIAPGARVTFDLRIEYAPYARYELFVQATQK